MDISNLSIEELLELRNQINDKLGIDGTNNYLKSNMKILNRLAKNFNYHYQDKNPTNEHYIFDNLADRYNKAVLVLTDIAFANYQGVVNVQEWGSEGDRHTSKSIKCTFKKFIPFDQKDEYVQMVNELQDVFDKHFKGASTDIKEV